MLVAQTLLSALFCEVTGACTCRQSWKTLPKSIQRSSGLWTLTASTIVPYRLPIPISRQARLEDFYMPGVFQGDELMVRELAGSHGEAVEGIPGTAMGRGARQYLSLRCHALL